VSDDIIRLAENLIGPADHRRLESYGAHVIQHGWATRFAWSEQDGDPRFDIFRGGADEFFAEDAAGQQIVAGPLDHVMAELDAFLEQRSGHVPPGA
jgi:hypothetical protein